MDPVYIATGYASNDIDLGCTTTGNIEFTALGTLMKKKQKNNDINLG